jgi:hypothetical protein
MNPDLLSQLRDIHDAAPVPWWPPAPGWWLLAVLALLLLGWLARRALLRLRVRRRRLQMLAWIDHLDTHVDPARDPHVYLATLNRIFKLVALRAFPDRQCASLSGQAWTDFLIEKMHKSPSAESLMVLASGPYDPAPVFDAEKLSGLTRSWIRQYG